VPEFFRTAVPCAPPRDSDGQRAASPLEPSSDSEAAARGTAIHRLLEKLAGLPPSDYEKAARAYPAELVETAAAILRNPEFGFIFKNKSYSEVELAYIDGEEAKTARIDRLVFAPDAIWIIDYKSDASVPDAAPEKYLGQIALYRSLVAKIYPDKKIRAAILWTSAPKLMEIP
jgi:ATP-dependent helicase/nuclease subunit A